MSTINIVAAKTSLSRLVAAIESGEAREFIIARNGRPVARLAPLEKPAARRLGLLDGKVRVPKDFDALNDKIAELFDNKG